MQCTSILLMVHKVSPRLQVLPDTHVSKGSSPGILQLQSPDTQVAYNPYTTIV